MFFLSEVEINNIYQFKELKISLNQINNIIVGTNGVGKSNFLNTIYYGLTDDSFFYDKSNNSSLKLTFKKKDKLNQNDILSQTLKKNLSDILLVYISEINDSNIINDDKKIRAIIDNNRDNAEKIINNILDNINEIIFEKSKIITKLFIKINNNLIPIKNDFIIKDIDILNNLLDKEKLIKKDINIIERILNCLNEEKNISSDSRFFYYLNNYIKNICFINNKKNQKPLSSKIKDMKENNYRNYKIIKTIYKKFSGYDFVEKCTNSDINIENYDENENVSYPLSNGEYEYLEFLIDIYDENNYMLLIDEPCSHLSPSKIENILNILNNENKQKLIITHNQDLITKNTLNNLIHFYKNNNIIKYRNIICKTNNNENINNNEKGKKTFKKRKKSFKKK